MKLKDIKDLKKFFDLVDKANDEVYVVEGQSKLSLKSKLCRLIISAKIDNGDIGEETIVCDNPDDYEMLKTQL